MAGQNEVVELWPGLAKGSAEVWVERSTTPGVLDRAVSNIHNPTLMVYLPEPGKGTGAALIIAAGGVCLEVPVGAREGLEVYGG